MLAAGVKKAEPHALRVAAMISAPILSKPKHVRDTMGWLAAWSLFVATCFAVFVFLIRTPHGPVSSDPEVRLADDHTGEGHSAEVVRHGLPHVEEPASGEHGSAAAEGGGHGDAKPKGKDAKKKADAKKPPAKKKDAKKKPDAQGAEAPAGH